MVDEPRRVDDGEACVEGESKFVGVDVLGRPSFPVSFTVPASRRLPSIACSAMVLLILVAANCTLENRHSTIGRVPAGLSAIDTGMG